MREDAEINVKFKNRDLVVIISKDLELNKSFSKYFLSCKTSCDKTIFLSEIPYNEIIKRDFKFSQDLKNFAHELNTCVVVFLQVNSKGELLLSNFRDIELDADVVIFIEYKDIEKNLVKCDIKKNKHGPTGKIDSII